MRNGRDVEERIAEDLRQGAFAPGSRLVQIALERRYGGSRAAIRSALEALAGRRLVRHEPNRGYSVHPADTEETTQILDLRRVLEAGFAPVVAARATAADVARLQALAEEFEACRARGRHALLYDANLRFHRALLALAGNPHLLALVDELRLRTAPAPVSQWADPARVERSSREHLLMVDAVRRRDGAGLAHWIARHILQDGAGPAPGSASR